MFFVPATIPPPPPAILPSMCQVGGLFGLMLGFSLVSFIELAYWLTARLASNCGHRSGMAFLGGLDWSTAPEHCTLLDSLASFLLLPYLQG